MSESAGMTRSEGGSAGCRVDMAIWHIRWRRGEACNAVEGMIGILRARGGSLAQIAAHPARSRRSVGGGL